MSRIGAGLVSGVWALSLFVAMFGVVLNVPVVRGSGTIYIRADGTIDPPTAPIQRDGDVYTFTDNINDYIIVERDNVVLDGAYRTGTGIGLSSRSNVTIKNMEIKGVGYGYGIHLHESSDNTISGNNITNNDFGIALLVSSNNIISGNNITNNELGIQLSSDSSHNTISGNNITNNTEGIALCGTNNNTISKNNVTANEQGIHVYNGVSNTVLRLNSIANNKYNFGVSGASPSDFVNDVDASNTVDGRPIYYWIGKEDMTVPPDAGYVALVNCTRITVQSQNLTHNFQGALLAYTTHSKITRNNITNNFWGIELWESSDNTVSVSNIRNSYYGISLIQSSNNNIMGNNLTNNQYCLSAASSPSNHVYHNNFVNNTYVYESYPTANFWDDGYPSGGNYWSDYTARYPEARELDDSGIWDTPYIINADNRDRYPLMNPWSPPEHELSASITVPASTKLGTSSFLNATVNNLGINDETDVEINILINGTIKDSTTVLLLRVAGSYTLVYQWTPTASGTYIVTAHVPPLPEEENTQNNQATEFVTVYTSLPPAPKVGVKAGDWIKIDYTISGAPSGTPLPQWIKIEFLSVEGTTVNVRVTMHMSDGTEPSQTMTVDVAVGSGAFQGLSGFIIPANCTSGDSVYISGYGNVTIAGEATRTYAGASRTVVCASFSQLGSQLTYYWDKQTGVMVEASTISGGITGTAKATETNMWQAQPSGLPFDQTYLYVLLAMVIAIAVGSIAFVMRRKKKPPEVVTPTAQA